MPREITVSALAPMSAGSTHPECATLLDPLFACGGKRVATIVSQFEQPNLSGEYRRGFYASEETASGLNLNFANT